MHVGERLMDRYFQGNPEGDFVAIHAELPLDLAKSAGVAGGLAVLNEVLLDSEAVRDASLGAFVVLGGLTLVTAGLRHIKNTYGFTLSLGEQGVSQEISDEK